MPSGDLPRINTVHPGGYLQCATYLIEGPSGAVLVDPGSGALEDEVLAGVREIGCSSEEVGFALLTHCHVDHARGAYRFRERGTKLVASPRTAEILRAGGHQVWYEYPDYVIPTEVDLTPADGERLELCGVAVTAVHTPGHTDGCVSYLVDTPDGPIVFTGDLLNHRGHPGWAGSEGFSAEDTLASIQRLIALSPVRAFRGHGAVEGDAVTWLERALELGRSGRWEAHTALHPQAAPPAAFTRRPT